LEIVSDDYIRLIPADKNWQPTPEAAASAEAYVAALFSDPGDHVWEVTSKFYDHVTLIDAGELTAPDRLPLCGTDITEWCFGLLGRTLDGRPEATAPGPSAPVEVTRLTL
jgi:hypothetical protein